MSVAKSSNRQMAINMASSICVFALNLCVSFFLTPFIVGRLGAAAYGFVGLSNNIIGYTALLTVAVNSMAGRFITIKVHEREIFQANVYMSSVFYANLALSVVVLSLLIGFTIFMPYLIRVPDDLLSDVRTLFVLLVVSSCLGLLTGVISVAAFIRNRLDILNIRNLIGGVIRVVLLLLLFGFFVPRLWYIGVSALVMGLYSMISNFYFYKRLTPELRINKKYFDFARLKEVASAGVWNILTKLSEILSRGFDLLLANMFISARAMGLLSITQVIPVMIIGFFGALTSNFMPEQIRLYALKDFEGLKQEFFKAMRICGFLSCIPLSILFAYGDTFYSLWLPTENARLLYLLTLAGSVGTAFAMPLEPLWNIFTITNKLRKSSLNLLYNSIGIFATILLSMFVVKDDLARLYILAGTRTFFGSCRCVIFLPRYGARCLGFSKWVFYPQIFKNLLNICFISALSVVFKNFFLGPEWGSLILGCVFTAIVGIGISSVTVLTSSDRLYIINRIKSMVL